MKPRNPKSFPAAVMQIIGMMTAEDAGAAVGKSPQLLYRWADPDCEGGPTIHCIRCDMTFNVEPYPLGQAARKPERHRCPECLGRFFSSAPKGHIRARVSVEPENISTIPQGV